MRRPNQILRLSDVFLTWAFLTWGFVASALVACEPAAPAANTAFASWLETHCCEDPAKLVICADRPEDIEHVFLDDMEMQIEGLGEATDVFGPMPEECKIDAFEGGVHNYYRTYDCYHLQSLLKRCDDQDADSHTRGLIVSYPLATPEKFKRRLSAVNRDGSAVEFSYGFTTRTQGYFLAAGERSFRLGTLCDFLDVPYCGAYYHVDINNDGKVDLVHPGMACNQHAFGGSCIETYLQEGGKENGFFRHLSSDSIGSYHFSNKNVSFADVSHDGQPDFLRLEPYSRDAHGPTLVTFLGDGTGGFVEEDVSGLPRHVGAYGDDWLWDSVAGDFDGDGASDVLVLRWASPAEMQLYTFADGSYHHVASHSLHWRQDRDNLLVADLDLDGIDDLVAADDSNAGFSAVLIHGLEPPTLATEIYKARWPDFHSIEIVDLNADGLPEILTISPAKACDVYRNLGDGAFEYWLTLGEAHDFAMGGMYVVDVDGNGVPEIGGRIKLFELYPSGEVFDRTLWLPEHFMYAMRGGAATHDIDGDGHNDFITPDDVFLWTDLGDFAR